MENTEKPDNLVEPEIDKIVKQAVCGDAQKESDVQELLAGATLLGKTILAKFILPKQDANPAEWHLLVKNLRLALSHKKITGIPIYSLDTYAYYFANYDFTTSKRPAQTIFNVKFLPKERPDKYDYDTLTPGDFYERGASWILPTESDIAGILRALYAAANNSASVLDVGAGSGLLARAIAENCRPDVEVVALDMLYEVVPPVFKSDRVVYSGETLEDFLGANKKEFSLAVVSYASMEGATIEQNQKRISDIKSRCILTIDPSGLKTTIKSDGEVRIPGYELIFCWKSRGADISVPGSDYYRVFVRDDLAGNVSITSAKNPQVKLPWQAGLTKQNLAAAYFTEV